MAKKTLKTRGTKTHYPSDVSDEEWEFCAPYLCLMKEDVPQRDYSPRGMFNAVRYMVRAGCPWRMIPNDLPPWSTVHQQARTLDQGGLLRGAGARSAQAAALALAEIPPAFGGDLCSAAVCKAPRKMARAARVQHVRGPHGIYSSHP